jgi:acyl-CoA reductase-like NAD-dependent aldehyde dehydrogenase
VGQWLVGHEHVALVNFTGSGAVADKLIRAIGLRRVLLELGGNAPVIIHDDADLDLAVGECVGAAFGLAGQSCISTQRIYAQRAVYDEVVARVVAATSALSVGDPLDEATRVGPMIDEGAARRVEAWIAEAVDAGATLHCGGERSGAFLTPAVLTGVAPDAKLVCAEVFGPVVTLAPYDTLGQAIDLANDSPWGLKAGVFTRSLGVALDAARRMEFGTVNVNGPSRARVDHEPSGGTKLSGWGTEGPRYAIEAMTYLRMVSVAA